MNEIEAHRLKPGDPVVVRRLGRQPRRGHVTRIYDYDMTAELASTLFDIPLGLAARFSFDGPIIQIQLEDGRETMWAPPRVERAPFELKAHCRFCEQVIRFSVPYTQYRELQAGASLEQVRLEPELRQTMECHLCVHCAKK